MTEETKAQKEKRLRLRDKHRKTTCSGCRYNYYNFPKNGDGWNVPVEKDYSCWHLELIKRGVCPLKG